jgi:hypothetical protein
MENETNLQYDASKFEDYTYNYRLIIDEAS